jgi:hypothetical protein
VGFFYLRQERRQGAGRQIDNTEDKEMADQTEARTTSKNLSLDGWAVAIALLLAVLVRLGVLKHVSW